MVSEGGGSVQPECVWCAHLWCVFWLCASLLRYHVSGILLLPSGSATKGGTWPRNSSKQHSLSQRAA